jgi:hypothetical protein
MSLPLIRTKNQNLLVLVMEEIHILIYNVNAMSTNIFNEVFGHVYALGLMLVIYITILTDQARSYRSFAETRIATYEEIASGVSMNK